jgi:hypothetical protein
MPEKQQKKAVRQSTARKYPAGNLPIAHSGCYSLLSPFDKSVNPLL